MSLSLFGTSGRANERGQISCTLSCRLGVHVSAQVALQRCPFLCMSSWIISLLLVGSFSMLKNMSSGKNCFLCFLFVNFY
jgi:hypothetical protein